MWLISSIELLFHYPMIHLGMPCVEGPLSITSLTLKSIMSQIHNFLVCGKKSVVHVLKKETW